MQGRSAEGWPPSPMTINEDSQWQNWCQPPPHLDEGETRRDFLLIATSAVGVVGTALAAWPFIDSMNPAADTLALAIDRRRSFGD